MPNLILPDNSSITPVESARNLGIIFDSNLFFDKHISNLSRLATFISVTSGAYAQLWTSTPPIPSRHLWFIQSSTTATLSTTTFHSHNSSDSRLSKTPWLVASLP